MLETARYWLQLLLLRYLESWKIPITNNSLLRIPIRVAVRKLPSCEHHSAIKHTIVTRLFISRLPFLLGRIYRIGPVRFPEFTYPSENTGHCVPNFEKRQQSFRIVFGVISKLECCHRCKNRGVYLSSACALLIWISARGGEAKFKKKTRSSRRSSPEREENMSLIKKSLKISWHTYIRCALP